MLSGFVSAGPSFRQTAIESCLPLALILLEETSRGLLMWRSSLTTARIVALFITAGVLVLMTGISIIAQTDGPSEARSAAAIAANAPEKSSSAESRRLESKSEVTDRVNALEESSRAQNAKLEAMEKVIAEQQR